MPKEKSKNKKTKRKPKVIEGFRNVVRKPIKYISNVDVARERQQQCYEMVLLNSQMKQANALMSLENQQLKSQQAAQSLQMAEIMKVVMAKLAELASSRVQLSQPAAQTQTSTVKNFRHQNADILNRAIGDAAKHVKQSQSSRQRFAAFITEINEVAVRERPDRAERIFESMIQEFAQQEHDNTRRRGPSQIASIATTSIYPFTATRRITKGNNASDPTAVTLAFTFWTRFSGRATTRW